MTASPRSRMLACIAPIVAAGWALAVLCLMSATSPAQAESPVSPSPQASSPTAPSERRGDDTARLGSAINRLAAALEKDAADRAQDKEAARLQIVVGVLGIRYRKIEELESEIRRIEHEEESLKDDLPLMNAEKDRVEAQGKMPDGEPTPGAKEEVDRLEMTIKLQEERIAKFSGQRQQLLNDVTDERHRLTRLEALIDTWLEKLQ